MDIKNSLVLKQEQKLVLTQKMQLSIKILQSSSIELIDYVTNEMEKNPVIDDIFVNINDNKKFRDDLIKKIKESNNYSKDYIDNNNYEDDDVSPFLFISSKKTLKEYLYEQICEINLSTTHKRTLIYLIECINKSGYLNEELSSVSERNKIPLKIVEKAHKTLLTLEPAGIGSRTLNECLKVQLKRKKISNSLLEEIIDNYLMDIGENRYNDMCKNLNISFEDAQKYGDIIKSLEPKPARGFFTGEETKYIIPDAYIEKINGVYRVLINDDIVPKLIINKSYENYANNKNEKYDDNSIKYIKDNLSEASFLIKAIEQRKHTLYIILDTILKIQKDYFEKGTSHLIPMTLKDISIETNFHESTISRAINEKYVQTENEIIRLKDLFTKGINMTNGSSEMSSNIIKEKIKEIVDREDKKKPLSDNDISNMLKELSIEISRRTVAKYREEMDIKASSKRKRY